MKKFRSKLPCRKRSKISPILRSSPALKFNSSSINDSSSNLTRDVGFVCDSSSVLSTNNKSGKKRSFADGNATVASEFRRITRSYSKRMEFMAEKEVEEVKEEMADILQDALVNGVERIDLSRRKLPFIPEAFGKLRTLVSLNLSSNKLMAIPDSVAGLENLEALDVSANLFESLPNAIGKLKKLQILNVSRNKLTSLPDGLCKCRSLVEFDASFNKIFEFDTRCWIRVRFLEQNPD